MAKKGEEFRTFQEWLRTTINAATGQWSLPELQPIQQLDNQGSQPTKFQGLSMGTQLHEPSVLGSDVTTYVFYVTWK